MSDDAGFVVFAAILLGLIGGASWFVAAKTGLPFQHVLAMIASVVAILFSVAAAGSVR